MIDNETVYGIKDLKMLREVNAAILGDMDVVKDDGYMVLDEVKFIDISNWYMW